MKATAPQWPNFPRRGDGCLVIGEVAQAHDGSLGMAHAFIDALARAGADAVKFQTHIASAESTPAERWRTNFSHQDSSRYDYWKRMEFSESQWVGLRKHADEVGLMFLSSPFSPEAVALLTRVGVAAWKIASGEVGTTTMLEPMIETGWPMLLSTGMSGLCEIDDTVRTIQSRGVPLAVLQCTSSYPCPAEKIGLNMIPHFRERYRCAVGLSDHSGTIYPGLAAAVLGAEVVEVHVTLSREMFGPDAEASITTAELRQLVEGIRFIERALGHPVDKNQLALEAQPLRKLFMKSVVARTDLSTGTVLRPDDLQVKKPGDGIPAARVSELIGMTLVRDVKTDELIRESDVEGFR
jgi:N-acetylneuraminate synthase